MKTKSNITTLDQILDKKYGKKGAPKREEWEQEFEAFQTQEEPSEKWAPSTIATFTKNRKFEKTNK